MKSTGIQGMMNKKFFGKKALAPTGNARKKAVFEKKLATYSQD